MIGGFLILSIFELTSLRVLGEIDDICCMPIGAMVCRDVTAKFQVYMVAES